MCVCVCVCVCVRVRVRVRMRVHVCVNRLLERLMSPSQNYPSHNKHSPPYTRSCCNLSVYIPATAACCQTPLTILYVCQLRARGARAPHARAWLKSSYTFSLRNRKGAIRGVVVVVFF